jgi:hypothetical protein
MKRRDFIAAVGGAAAVWPGIAWAQTTMPLPGGRNVARLSNWGWGAVVTGVATVCIGLVQLHAIRPLSAQSGTQGFTFALIGDLGYVPNEEAWTESVFAEISGDAALSFVIHDGDLSSPRFGCTDELVQRRLAQFNAIPHPVIYTPGDNDWTDCHGQNVTGGNPLERLAKLRKVFFQADQSLGGRTLPVLRQSQSPEFSKFRENVRLDYGGIIFVTLHVTGSNNGLGREPDGDAEYEDRNKANLSWLSQAFAHAKAANSRAIMIIQQANMWPEWPPFPGKPGTPSGFTALRNLLEQEATAFKKPVVLVNGDSHYFRIDNPYRKSGQAGQRPLPSLENFLRVETFGTPNHHWLHVTVEPNDPNVFTFRPRIVSKNVIKRD